MIEFVIDPHPSDAVLNALWRRAWNAQADRAFGAMLERSLCHIMAVDGRHAVGFVNVAWDGGEHAFLLDTCVDPDYRGRGIATALVGKATETARARGAVWLHVDYEPHLDGFYRGCGFVHTAAGLMRLD